MTLTLDAARAIVRPTPSSLEQGGHWITHSRKHGQTAILSRAELDRFFDNRDPAEWSCPTLTGSNYV